MALLASLAGLAELQPEPFCYRDFYLSKLGDWEHSKLPDKLCMRDRDQTLRVKCAFT